MKNVVGTTDFMGNKKIKIIGEKGVFDIMIKSDKDGVTIRYESFVGGDYYWTNKKTPTMFTNDYVRVKFDDKIVKFQIIPNPAVNQDIIKNVFYIVETDLFLSYLKNSKLIVVEFESVTGLYVSQFNFCGFENIINDDNYDNIKFVTDIKVKSKVNWVTAIYLTTIGLIILALIFPNK